MVLPGTLSLPAFNNVILNVARADPSRAVKETSPSP